MPDMAYSYNVSMDTKKKSKPKKSSGRVTSVREFLGMTETEAAVVEIRVELAAAVRKKRLAAGLTQAELANTVGSTQSRIAKIEAADPQASLESMVGALVAAGARVHLRVA
jgi:ribosome-binding protein aMBF1 (putative translation factor)